MTARLEPIARRTRGTLRGVRVQAGEHPVAMPLLLRGQHRRARLTSRTDIVIEGFPRSGNTFAVTAFRRSQPAELRISNHTHYPGQVLRAVRLGIPTLVVVRPAVASAVSLSIAIPHLGVVGALGEWVRYHERIEPVVGQLVLATFDEVTTDFGAVVRRLNERFGTDFAMFEHSDSKVSEVFGAIDDWNVRLHGSLTVRDLARPSSERAEAAASSREELSRRVPEHRVRQAESLYQRLVDAR